MQLIDKSLEIHHIIFSFHSWYAYGQSQSDRTFSTEDLENDIEQASVSEISNSNNSNSVESQIIPSSENLQDIKSGLNQFLVLYKNQQAKVSVDLVQSIHLDAYQKVIVPLNTLNPDMSLALETKFTELIEMVNAQRPYVEMVNKVNEIDSQLDAYRLIVSSTNSLFSPTVAFASSVSIIFREGLEASIILGAIITYLEASRNERFKRYVYHGIMIALLATIGIWFLLDYALRFSGIDKDLLKGTAGMAAVAVLFWVSFWVLNRMESRKWVEFIKSRVGKAATTGSVMIFILISFFTVFREGLETVIFYHSLFNFTSNIDLYIISGMILGIIVVITIAILIKKIMKKLPLRVIFGITMGIGAFMSVAFMGNAIRSFQEAGYIQTTPFTDAIPILDTSIASMTGIHPTLESLLGQIVLVGIYLVGLTFMILVKSKEKKKLDHFKLKSNG
jgi:high-affinity iron transporter